MKPVTPPAHTAQPQVKPFFFAVHTLKTHGHPFGPLTARPASLFVLSALQLSDPYTVVRLCPVADGSCPIFLGCTDAEFRQIVTVQPDCRDWLASMTLKHPGNELVGCCCPEIGGCIDAPAANFGCAGGGDGLCLCSSCTKFVAPSYDPSATLNLTVCTDAADDQGTQAAAHSVVWRSNDGDCSDHACNAIAPAIAPIMLWPAPGTINPTRPVSADRIMNDNMSSAVCAIDPRICTEGSAGWCSKDNANIDASTKASADETHGTLSGLPKEKSPSWSALSVCASNQSDTAADIAFEVDAVTSSTLLGNATMVIGGCTDPVANVYVSPTIFEGNVPAQAHLSSPP